MNPSLLLIPDRYKASKLYSQIPDSGAGDLSFTRANDTATRVNSAGLIEKVRTNLLTHSQDFSNPAWVKTGLTLTAGQTDPNGGTTAFLATATAIASSYFYQTNSTAGCVSVFAKAGTRSKFSIINGLFAQGAEFDLAAQTTIVSGAGSLAKIESVGGGWFRCSVFLSSVSDVIIALDEVFGGGVTIGQTMIFAFAQHETGDIATPYIPTTTAAVSVGMLANIPRIDYTGGGCGKLLLEPQRTNLLLFSEQLNNAEYTVDAGAFSANAGISPDGFINAELLTENSSNAGHGFYAPVVARGTTGQPLTTSIFAKANGRRYISLIGGFDSGNAYYALFDLQDGVVAAFSNTGSTTYIGSTITNFGNGWYRCTLTGSTTLTNRLLFSYLADSPTGISALGIKTYTGNGTAGVFLYGLQAEAGSYATSYIPTLGASVTRSADSASKTGISSLIGTEFTIFYDGFETIGGQATRYLVLKGSGGTYANAVFIEGSSGNSLALSVLNNASANVFSAISASLINGQRIKFAVRCKDNDFAFYVNGSLVAAQASGSVPTTADLYLGNYVDFADNYSLPTTAAIYTSGLSNAELATLTSL